jgi:hypothetical protein
MAAVVENILTFDGTNAALMGEEALKAGGLSVRVMARPNSLGAQCGFCLRVDPADLRAATQILQKAGLAIKGVYDLAYDAKGRVSYEETSASLWAT